MRKIIKLSEIRSSLIRFRLDPNTHTHTSTTHPMYIKLIYGIGNFIT